MEASSFIASIAEFDFDISLEKTHLGCNNEYYSFQEVKKYLYFITGQKIKKKVIETQLLSPSSIDKISKNELYSLYHLYIKQITNHDIISAFYTFIKSNNETISLSQFLNQMKMLYPNINDNLLSQIFLYIDKGNFGELRISDLESALLNQLN